MKIRTLTLAFIIFANPAFARTVTLDAKSVGTVAAGTTVTISHTIASQADTVLVAYCGDKDNVSVTGVTWSGSGSAVAMTAVANGSTVANIVGSWWTLKAPVAATSNIIGTFGSTITMGGCMGFSVYNVNQSAVAVVNTSRSHSNYSVDTVDNLTVTPTFGGSMIFGESTINLVASHSAQSPLVSQYDNQSVVTYSMSAGNYVVPSAGGQVIGFLEPAFSSHVQCAIALAPVCQTAGFFASSS